MPEKYHLFPKIEKAVDRVKNIAWGIGYLLTRQMLHEPRPVQSDHYQPPGASIKAVHQKEWEQLNLPEVPTQDEIVEVFNRDWEIHDGHDSEGRYITPRE